MKFWIAFRARFCRVLRACHSVKSDRGKVWLDSSGLLMRFKGVVKIVVTREAKRAYTPH